MVKVSDVMEFMNEIAPEDQAVADDPIGLHIGDRNAPVERIGVALDASRIVVEDAIAKNLNMLVTHHPLIYNPLRRVVAEDAVSERVLNLARNSIALYCAHTNFDRAPGGTNDTLAAFLGLRDIEHIILVNSLNMCKLVVFAPKEDAEHLAQALGDAGAGSIGLYSHCSFQVYGTGHFKPLHGANPHIGTIGKLESVEEARIEMICPENILGRLLSVLHSVHPYESPAYDIYPLRNSVSHRGLGRVGNLSESTTLEKFAKRINDLLRCNGLRVYGNITRPIQRIAICCGGGSRYYTEANAHGADIYITGDVAYHDTVDLQKYDMAVIDAGHFETELPGVMSLCNSIKSKFEPEGVQVSFLGQVH